MVHVGWGVTPCTNRIGWFLSSVFFIFSFWIILRSVYILCSRLLTRGVTLNRYNIINATHRLYIKAQNEKLKNSNSIGVCPCPKMCSNAIFGWRLCQSSGRQWILKVLDYNDDVPVWVLVEQSSISSPHHSQLLSSSPTCSVQENVHFWRRCATSTSAEWRLGATLTSSASPASSPTSRPSTSATPPSQTSGASQSLKT